MKSIFIVFLLLFCTALISCSGDHSIVQPKDYEVSLKDEGRKSLANCTEEILFWSHKLDKTPTSAGYQSKLAGTYAKRFSITGAIEDTFISDSLYKASLTLDSGRVGAYQALAVNCMARHEFRQARNYVNKALKIGDNKSSSLFALFDINMELGDYAGAKFVIGQFENKSAFAYLIRQAKIDDKEGHLNLAIEAMERALDRIKEDPAMYCWTLSNLGDMYGHAGKVEDAYKAYLDVLKKAPNNDIALKGIAWIALSHDHNPAEAKRIANTLSTRKEMPDMHLLLAKIAEQEGDYKEENKQLNLFKTKASGPKYGAMYNKYIALLEAEKFSNPERTVEIATIEIQNRPTPQSYDLLAWGYFQSGNTAKAIAVATQKIEARTFEPEAYYHLGMMYTSIDKRKSETYLEKALKSSFELGPAITAKIRGQLNHM